MPSPFAEVLRIEPALQNTRYPLSNPSETDRTCGSQFVVRVSARRAGIKTRECLRVSVTPPFGVLDPQSSDPTVELAATDPQPLPGFLLDVARALQRIHEGIPLETLKFGLPNRERSDISRAAPRSPAKPANSRSWIRLPLTSNIALSITFRSFPTLPGRRAFPRRLNAIGVKPRPDGPRRLDKKSRNA